MRNKELDEELSRVFPGMMSGIYDLVNIQKSNIYMLDILNREQDTEKLNPQRDNNLKYHILSSQDNVENAVGGRFIKSYELLMKVKSKYSKEDLEDISGDFFINSWEEFLDKNGMNVTKILQTGLGLSGSPVYSFHDEKVKTSIDKDMYEYIKDRITWSVTTPENSPNHIIPFMFDYKEGAKVLSSTSNLVHLKELSELYYEEIKKAPQNKQEEITLYLAEKLLYNKMSNLEEHAIFNIFNKKEKELIFNKLGEENPHSLVIKRLKNEIEHEDPVIKKSSSLKI